MSLISGNLANWFRSWGPRPSFDDHHEQVLPFRGTKTADQILSSVSPFCLRTSEIEHKRSMLKLSHYRESVSLEFQYYLCYTPAIVRSAAGSEVREVYLLRRTRLPSSCNHLVS